MKRIGLCVDDELHKKLKLHSVSCGKSITEIIQELVKKELENQKEQSH